MARDDGRQTSAAEAFIVNGAWVSFLALAEAVWVLASVYGLNAEDQARGIEMLLDHRQLVLQDHESVAAALTLFRADPSLGFSDCLTLEMVRKAEHLPLGTFDRKLGKIEGAQKL